MHRLLLRLVVLCAVAGTSLCVPGIATADTPPVFTASRNSGPIRGDVTGDGVADTVVLGYLGDRPQTDCVAQVRTGLGHGVLGAPVLLPLPVRGRLVQCPDLGTVLLAPTPAANRLAVGFFNVPPADDGARIQVFSLVGGRATYRIGSSTVQLQPSHLGSQDFDGDGWGDLWEDTDQGDGFGALLVHGATIRPLASVSSGSFPGVQFADLNHGRGTDILVTSRYGFGPARAVVIDGLTGASQELASGRLAGGTSVETYRLGLVDLDHDTYADLRVDAVAFGGRVVATTYFANRSRGGRWYFSPATPPRV